MTASPRVQFPTLRGRQTQAAIDAAARSVIARKGILATTISDIAAEAGKSTASFYNYYDSKEAMVREWALRFRDEARERSRAAAEPGLSNWERSYKAVAAHWHTYRHQLAEIISVSQLAMVNEDFAEYWNDICSLPTALITHMVKHAQQQGFCADDDPSSGRRGAGVDAQPVLLHTAGRGQGGAAVRRRRRRGMHHHACQHLLPDDLSQGGGMTRTPASGGTPGVTREFVGLPSPTARRAGAGGNPCQGLYYRGVGRKPKVAMIATHYQIDFSEHYLADYMATRGIGFLGWNTRYRGFESSFLLDHALVDIGVGVRWLREVQGVEIVVLLGNSGGGSLMAAYQAQAVDPHVTPLEGMRPAAGLNDLLPADGYIASAAHPGRPEVLTAWMDASVVDESDAVTSDPDA